MALISNTIPNLINGVSQQPARVRLPSQCEEMLNCYPTLDAFLRRRPVTRHLAKLMSGQARDVHIHTINRDSDEQYIVVFLSGALKVFRLDGTEVPVTFPQGWAYLPTEKVSSALRCMTINDYTFVVNTNKTVRMTANRVPVPIPQALAFVKATNYATTYTITLDGVAYSHATPNNDNNGTYKLSSSDIAEHLAAQIRASAPGFQVVVQKSTLYIRRYDAGGFSVQVTDSRSNTHLSLATNSVQRFSDLPTVAPHGYTCEILGEASSSFDNYYVTFEVTTPGTNFGQGVWVESAQPGSLCQLDATTMPHSLVRTAEGTFRFEPLQWENRLCGDDDSVPLPSFINRKLSSMFFYRNRLGFLANENVVMSEAGAFFNFFATTATATIDSDPVDVAASHTRATSLYHAVPFSEGLMLFSDRTQFKLEHPSDLLSNSTVAVKPLTEFEASPGVEPVGAGKNIFFVTPRGRYSNVMEYYVQEDSALTDAANVTAHVPRYLPSGIHRLVVSSNEDVLLALSVNNPEEVCVYKYLWNGNEKLQSAWFKWRFSGAVLGAAFVETEVYMVVQYDDGLYLEVLDTQPGYADPGLGFEYILDRKVFEEDCLFIIYNDVEDTSMVTLPYSLPDNAAYQIVTRPGVPDAHPGVIREVVSVAGDTVTVRGDIRGIPFTGGVSVPSRFVFSEQHVRGGGEKQDGAPVLGGRLQMRNMLIYYNDSGFFQVDVAPLYRDISTYLFTGRLTSHGDNVLGETALTDGVFQVPLLSKADQVTISIHSESYLPFHFVNAEWEGFYHIRSSRL